MANITPSLLILLPILLGLLWIWHPRFIKSWLPGLSVAAFSINLIILCIALLSNTVLQVSVSWQPKAGVMGITLDSSSLLLIFLLSLAFYIAFVTRIRSMRDSIPIQIGLSFFSWSTATIALTADHFLLRYVALEFTGLCLVGTMLDSQLHSESKWINLRTLFLNFRLGDLAFLVAILLMYSKLGTFQINDSLESTLNSPAEIRIITTVGLLSAVWVKMQIWPLDLWKTAISKLASRLQTWYSDILMPVLGIYLLYRTSPLIQSSELLSSSTNIAIIFASVIKILRPNGKTSLFHYNERVQFFSSISLIAMATLGQKSILWAYLIYWLINKVLFAIGTIKHEHSPPKANSGFNLSNSFYCSSELVFSLFAIFQISQVNYSFSPLYIPLWIFWWMLMIQYFQNYSYVDRQGSQKSLSKIVYKKLLYPLGVLFGSIVTAGIISFFIDWISIVIKGYGASILPGEFVSGSTAILIFLGLVLALFLTHSIVNKTDNYFARISKRIELRFQHILPTPKVTQTTKYDPLDQTQRFTELLIASIDRLYRAIEQNSVDKLNSIFKKSFVFLFDKVEQLTSVELWKNTLRTVIKSSRGIQQWHPGLLRLNMLWFLLFIFILFLVLINSGISFGLFAG